jgi:hypothetical protein
MERFKVTDLGDKKVVMAFDGSGWRVTEMVELKSNGSCPACGRDTSASPGVYYTVSRAKHKGKEPVCLCIHEPDEVEKARRVLGV